MRWIALGTNGFFPSWGRQTMSFLVRRGESALLLDAGTGLGRLVEPGPRSLIDDLDRLDILLTHYHLDHVVGLASLSGLWSRPVRIFAPGRPLVDAEPEEALRRLVAPPLFPREIDDMGLELEIVPYAGLELVAGGLRLALRRQRHPGGSVGVRIGDELAYVTDTEPDPGTVELVSGVGTLLHEVWDTRAQADEPGYRLGGHSSTPAVAEIADAASVGLLVPIHHRPQRSAEEVLAVVDELAGLTSRPVRLAVEGETYRCPGATP